MSTEEKEIILRVADKGRRRFQDKLDWLTDYQDSLSVWTNILAMTRNVESQVKKEGFAQTTLSQWDTLFTQSSVSQNLVPTYQKIRHYLLEQTSIIPEGEIFLGTSDGCSL
jgi:hypothetical protein